MRVMAWSLVLSVACAGCAVATEETTDNEPAAEEAQGEGPETGEVQEASKADQETLVTLPHAGPFRVGEKTLLGHPFAVAADKMVTIAIDSHWENGACPLHSFAVTLRDFGTLGGHLQVYAYPSGTIHTEHWKIPTTGKYRLEITIENHPLGCGALLGHANITSP